MGETQRDSRGQGCEAERGQMGIEMRLWGETGYRDGGRMGADE